MKACWKLGILTADLFVTSDLINKKGIPQVVQNVYAVIRLAQSKPSWKGPIMKDVPPLAKKLDPNAKKWPDVNTQPVVKSVEALERERANNSDNVAIEVERERKLRMQLEKEVEELKKALKEKEKQCFLLEKENHKLSSQLNSLSKSNSNEDSFNLDESKIQTLQRELDIERAQRMDLQEKLQDISKKYIGDSKEQDAFRYALRATTNYSGLPLDSMPGQEEENSTSSILFTLQEFLWNLLSSSPSITDFKTSVERLNPLLQTEIGRRHFIEGLRTNMHKV